MTSKVDRSTKAKPDLGADSVPGVRDDVESGPRDTSQRRHSAAAQPPDSVHTDRLLTITAAIAHAVSSEQVFEAVVDRVASALGASNAALWLVDDDRRTLRLRRTCGYHEAAKMQFDGVAMDTSSSFPALDVARTGESIWIPNQSALLLRYPHLKSVVTPGRAYRIACLPLSAQARVIGTLAVTMEGAGDASPEERELLQFAALYTSRAIERVRLLESERESREKTQQLYEFAQAAVAADSHEAVYDAALAAVQAALGAQHSAILVFDADGVMRFRAWHGLSELYRASVEGHSPWLRETRYPEPIWVADALADVNMAAYHTLFRQEGIAALAFVPLVTDGRLLGKLMIYYDRPHIFAPQEVEAARAIASHVASVITRFAGIARLAEIVRQNELFAGVLAHDLRNPLGAIIMAAQLMLLQGERGGDGGAEAEERQLARILSSGQRMKAMIDQLLDFTRARSGGGIEVDPQAANLAELLEHALAELELAHPDWKIQRELRGDHAGTWDSDRLLQVLSNVVANAGQHGAVDAPILIKLDGSERERLRIEVQNAGIIPESLMPVLFEPFRMAQHRRDRSRGLGLGLFIVREIVRAHGGAVYVESSEAFGTTFRIDLPRHSRRERRAPASAAPPAMSAGQSSPSKAPAGPAGDGHAPDSGEKLVQDGGSARGTASPGAGNVACARILLVDDDLDIREALTDTLEDRGYDVNTAANGLEALKILRGAGAAPTVILLDLMMPVMDGYGFLEERRKDPALRAIPVIVITAGHGIDRDRLGKATPIIPKPINLPQLMNTIDTCSAAGAAG